MSKDKLPLLFTRRTWFNINTFHLIRGSICFLLPKSIFIKAFLLLFSKILVGRVLHWRLYCPSDNNFCTIFPIIEYWAIWSCEIIYDQMAYAGNIFSLCAPSYNSGKIQVNFIVPYEITTFSENDCSFGRLK